MFNKTLELIKRLAGNLWPFVRIYWVKISIVCTILSGIVAFASNACNVWSFLNSTFGLSLGTELDFNTTPETAAVNVDNESATYIPQFRNYKPSKPIRYSRFPENEFDEASFEITPLSRDRIRVKGIALYGKQNTGGPNMGELNFESKVVDGRIRFKDPAPYNRKEVYRVEIKFNSDGLTVDEKNAHRYGFFGMNVRFAGNYRVDPPYGNLKDSIKALEEEFSDIDICTEKRHDKTYMQKYEKAMARLKEIASLANESNNDEAISWYNQKSCFGRRMVLK